MNDDVRSIIRNYIEERRLVRRSEVLTDSTQLGSSGHLDSLAMMELVLFLETQFNIEFSSHDLDRRRLDTIEQIERLVHAKRAALANPADQLTG